MTPETVPSGCVDESTLVRFFAGDLPMDRLTSVELHLDRCPDCARLIEAAAPLLAGVSGPGRLLALPAQVEPGQLVAGRYRIEGLIGQGATGYVLRARDELAGVPVAVKLLRSERAAQPALMQLFTRELRVARALNHPHVCRVFDLQTSGEDRFLVMELAEGSLRDELRSGSAAGRALDERLRDGEAIAAGLGAIHDAGIVHRDVKPENVLRLGDGRLVLSDFGLATLAPLGSATRYVGTPLYMAPEVAAGEPATRASDLYSLGLVLHELFFGRRPSWQASNGRRVRKDPPRLRGLQSMKSRAIARLTGQLLEELPERRPVDARAVLGRLSAIRQGRKLGIGLAASCNRRSFIGVSAAFLGGGVAFAVARGKTRRRTRAAAQVSGAPDTLPSEKFIDKAWRASFTSVGIVLVNRPGGDGFELVDLKRGRMPGPVAAAARFHKSTTGKDAVISPGGHYIAFVTGSTPDLVNQHDLWIQDQVNDEVERLAPAGRGGYPAWAGDGRTLYYCDRQERALIAHQDPATSQHQPRVLFADMPSLYPAVNPDGKAVAFGNPDGLAVLRVADRREWFFWPMPGRRGSLTSWSPDGRLIAFTGFGDDPLGVWVLDWQLARAVKVGGQPSGRPAWSLDGRQLTFDTKFRDPPAIYMVSTDVVREALPRGLTPEQFDQHAAHLPLKA